MTSLPHLLSSHKLSIPLFIFLLTTQATSSPIAPTSGDNTQLLLRRGSISAAALSGIVIAAVIAVAITAFALFYLTYVRAANRATEFANERVMEERRMRKEKELEADEEK